MEQIAFNRKFLSTYARLGFIRRLMDSRLNCRYINTSESDCFLTRILAKLTRTNYRRR
jgi:hypothetical protein